MPIRGNIDTRIGYVHSGELDAVVLAAAGLDRIGRLDEATEMLAPTPYCPPPARGHWRSSARRPTRTWPPSSRSSTTRSPGPP